MAWAQPAQTKGVAAMARVARVVENRWRKKSKSSEAGDFQWRQASARTEISGQKFRPTIPRFRVSRRMIPASINPNPTTLDESLANTLLTMYFAGEQEGAEEGCWSTENGTKIEHNKT
jgi:hypothetical protein